MRRTFWSTLMILPAVGLAVWLGGLAGLPGSFEPTAAFAAEPLEVEGLPSEPAAYRQRVEQILEQADRLIEKLKAEQGKEGVVLELIQARDGVEDEAYKVDHHPPGSAWTTEEARADTDAALKVLKAEYDSAAAGVASS